MLAATDDDRVSFERLATSGGGVDGRFTRPTKAFPSTGLILPLLLRLLLPLYLLLALVMMPVNGTGDDVSPKEPATFLPTNSSNVTVSHGDAATLSCRVANLGSNTVTWRRQGATVPMTIGRFPFAADSRVSVEVNEELGEWRLVIVNVGLADAGVYHCQITSKGSRNSTCDVRLIVKAVHIAGTDHVQLGRPIRLSCSVATSPSDPGPDVHWYHDDALLATEVTSSRFVVTRSVDSGSVVEVLFVARSSLEDSGRYACRASNTDQYDVIVVHVIGMSASSGHSGSDSRTHRTAMMTNIVSSFLAAVAAILTTELLCLSLPTGSVDIAEAPTIDRHVVAIGSPRCRLSSRRQAAAPYNGVHPS